MNKQKIKQILQNYVKIIITIYIFTCILRILELYLVFQNYGFQKEILTSELLGWAYDLLLASIIVVLCYPLYVLTSRFKKSFAKYFGVFFLITVIAACFVVIKYFVYQLIPLDIFLYKYSVHEILFTIKTADTNLPSSLFIFVLIIAFILFVLWGLNKINIHSIIRKITYSVVLISLPLFFIVHFLFTKNFDRFSINKPLYFVIQSANYFLGDDSKEITNNYADEFQELYPHKTFISKNYPLVYKANRENKLNEYFSEFDQSPNIVILIIEGLNDDFIHNYKGSILMPFLNQLKNKSLYWNHCFTLGERSFAVVPSILGGLPYGEMGFTLQERLPKHLSLVSILKSNHYYTSFYYGQGAWFHQKDRFFKYNDIDLIFDNSKFSSEYKKIIVGDNHFFWGYSDKDLFSQSLQVIDTLNQLKRLDVYFSGTSHSPFYIENENDYTKKLEKHINDPYRKFYETYSKYLKTVLYVDDALNDFFDEYKKQADYENTIFIITGDHPMTELPIDNSLKRYHVPLIIFSEKLKEYKTFSNPVSHLDVPETLLSFMQNFVSVPTISTSIGNDLFLNKDDHAINIAFMNDNREVVDFLSNEYYLTGKKLFRVDTLLNIHGIDNDSIKSDLSYKLNIFRNTNLYTTINNKIISNEWYCEALNHLNIYTSQNDDSIEFSSEYFGLINKIEVPNINLLFDFSANISANKYDDVSLIYEISNAADSTLLWRNSSINTEGKYSQSHIQIQQIPVSDSILFFKSYLWNRSKSNLMVSDINLLLHTMQNPESNNSTITP